MFRFLALLIVPALVALPVAAQDKGHSALVAQAKQAVSKDFKDPDSAKYRNLGIYKSTTGKGGVSVCGEVNAKNSFGAYAGYRRFVVHETLVHMEEEGDGGMYSVTGPALCHQKIADAK